MAECWLGGQAPADAFPHYNRWKQSRIPNTGMCLATGDRIRSLGTRALPLFDKLRHTFMMGEQTILDSLVYENNLPFFELSADQHCMAWEKHIKHLGVGVPYVDTVPMLGTNPVVFRHFCGRSNKVVLAKLMPALKKKFKLG
jgi:hypothetical protein